MISIITKVFDTFKTITFKDVFYLGVICLLVWSLYSSHIKYNDMNDAYKNNIESFKDTVSYYKSKTGELIAIKTGFECDIKELKIINESLYNEVKELKAKNKVLSAVNFSGKIENPSVDTVYQIKHDTIYNGFNHKFNFNDKWRTLKGKVIYKTDSLKVNILKDEIYFDYTLAIDEENKIYLKSSNPYVKYNEYCGFTVPTYKPKRIIIGPSITTGYSVLHNRFDIVVGLSATLNLYKK